MFAFTEKDYQYARNVNRGIEVQKEHIADVILGGADMQTKIHWVGRVATKNALVRAILPDSEYTYQYYASVAMTSEPDVIAIAGMHASNDFGDKRNFCIQNIYHVLKEEGLESNLFPPLGDNGLIRDQPQDKHVHLFRKLANVFKHRYLAFIPDSKATAAADLDLFNFLVTSAARPVDNARIGIALKDAGVVRESSWTVLPRRICTSGLQFVNAKIGTLLNAGAVVCTTVSAVMYRAAGGDMWGASSRECLYRCIRILFNANGDGETSGWTVLVHAALMLIAWGLGAIPWLPTGVMDVMSTQDVGSGLIYLLTVAVSVFLAPGIQYAGMEAVRPPRSLLLGVVGMGLLGGLYMPTGPNVGSQPRNSGLGNFSNYSSSSATFGYGHHGYSSGPRVDTVNSSVLGNFSNFSSSEAPFGHGQRGYSSGPRVDTVNASHGHGPGPGHANGHVDPEPEPGPRNQDEPEPEPRTHIMRVRDLTGCFSAISDPEFDRLTSLYLSVCDSLMAGKDARLNNRTHIATQMQLDGRAVRVGCTGTQAIAILHKAMIDDLDFGRGSRMQYLRCLMSTNHLMATTEMDADAVMSSLGQRVSNLQTRPGLINTARRFSESIQSGDFSEATGILQWLSVDTGITLEQIQLFVRNSIRDATLQGGSATPNAPDAQSVSDLMNRIACLSSYLDAYAPGVTAMLVSASTSPYFVPSLLGGAVAAYGIVSVGRRWYTHRLKRRKLGSAMAKFSAGVKTDFTMFKNRTSRDATKKFIDRNQTVASAQPDSGFYAADVNALMQYVNSDTDADLLASVREELDKKLKVVKVVKVVNSRPTVASEPLQKAMDKEYEGTQRAIEYVEKLTKAKQQPAAVNSNHQAEQQPAAKTATPPKSRGGPRKARS